MPVPCPHEWNTGCHQGVPAVLAKGEGYCRADDPGADYDGVILSRHEVDWAGGVQIFEVSWQGN